MKTFFLKPILVCLVLMVVSSCNLFKKTKDPEPKGSEKEVLSFSFNQISPAVVATIDAATKTITATVPTGSYVTKLVPTIAISAKASLSPATDVAQDFSSAVTYTVTAEDGSVQAYIAKVMVTAFPAPTITQVSPNNGKAGDRVVVTGTNFNSTFGSNVVKLNGKAAKVVAGNTTTLTVEIPEKAGTGTLMVETNGQAATSGSVFNFYYSAAIEKVAGGFRYPQNIAMDGKGNIYVPDRQNGQIKRINTNGTVDKIAGSTPADIHSYKYNVKGSEARFAVITGLAVDASGENLYAVDERTVSGFQGGAILKIDLTTSNYFVQQLGVGQIGHPTGIWLDEVNKKLYINYFSANTLAGRVATMNTDGSALTTLIGNSNQAGFNSISAGDVNGTLARLRAPAGSFLTKDGQSYYLAEEHNHAIRLYSVATKKVRTLTGTGIASTKNVAPTDKPVGNAEMVFNQPTGIALDSEGRIYVTEWNARKALWVYDPKAGTWQVLLNNLRNPYGLIINNKDELFISEWTGTNDSILKVTIK